MASRPARRESIGRSPVAVRTVGSAGGGPVHGIGDEVEVARCHVGPAGIERGQHDPGHDDREHQPGHDPDAVAQGDRDERRDRPFGGHDRRDDRDLPDPERGIRQLETDDVADPGETEQRERGRLERRWSWADDGDRQTDHDPDDHHPAEDEARPDHPARARGTQRGGGPQHGSAEAADDGSHGSKCGGWPAPSWAAALSGRATDLCYHPGSRRRLPP